MRRLPHKTQQNRFRMNVARSLRGPRFYFCEFGSAGVVLFFGQNRMITHPMPIQIASVTSVCHHQVTDAHEEGIGAGSKCPKAGTRPTSIRIKNSPMPTSTPFLIHMYSLLPALVSSGDLEHRYHGHD